MAAVSVTMIMKTDVAWPVNLIWFTLVTAPLLVLWFFFLPSDRYRMRCNLPPGPATLPIIGNMHQFANARNDLLDLTSKLAETYGPIFSMKIGVKNFVFVSSPELVHDILKTQDKLFAYRPLEQDLGIKRYMFYGDKHITLGQLGEYHTFYRKLVVTELLNQKKLQSFEALRLEELGLVVREAFEASTSMPKKPIDMQNLFNTFAINVITRMVISRKFFGFYSKEKSECTEVEDWKAAIQEAENLFRSFLMEDAIPSLKWIDTLTGARRRMQSLHFRIDSLLQKVLDDHRKHLDGLDIKELAEMEPKDFMELLLLLNKRENASHITDENSKAVGLDLIFAATKTSSHSLEWALSELIANPDVMKRAQEEVDAVVGKGRCVHESDVPKLLFLAAVVKETFRLHPAVPWLLPRSCRVDCKVGGYNIPKESSINIDIFAMGRNPTYWVNPLKFDPERFLISDDADLDMNNMHMKLLPFGAGRRICLGMTMANNNIKLTLAQLIHSFDWSPLDGHKFDMSYGFNGALYKKDSLKAVPTPRLPFHLYNT